MDETARTDEAGIKAEMNEAAQTDEAKDLRETRVVILATSDLHGNVWGYSYEDNAETANDGMARLYTYISRVRAENPVVFLVDGGDCMQGTRMTDAIANLQPDREHPVMAAMNYMQYDSMTVGNHEFDWGMGTMKKILGQASFPVLAENVLDGSGGYVTGNGWTIIERGGVRLGVIGVCTPDVPIWDGRKEGVGETTFEAANTAVSRALARIRDRADIILVSAHMGQYAEYDEEGGSDSGEKIVEDNPEADILQAAHMHITVNGQIGTTPVVSVRSSGREIARVDVTLDRDRRITHISTQIVDMAGYGPSPQIRGLPVVRDLHGQAVRLVREDAGEEGEKGEPLGTTTAKFQPENEIRGLPEGRLRDTAAAELILKVQLLNSGADVTAASLYMDTCDLPAGEICYSDILNLYRFDNTLVTVNVTGRELKDYMEWTAGSFNRWVPGDINISFDPDFPVFQFDMFAGVEYEIDPSRPVGERIVNVMYRGEPLGDDRILKLAVSNFRYAANLKGGSLIKGRRDWESAVPVREMIAAYFAEHSPVAPVVDHNWRLTGVDLSRDDPRRAKIVGWINAGLLPPPYHRSYNLADYDALAARAGQKG